MEVFDQRIGNKIDRSSSSNGVQFKSWSGVSVTLWKKRKEQESTILVNGKKDLYLDFAEKEMRVLYSSVKCKVSKEDDSQPAYIPKKRKWQQLPNVNTLCSQCPKENNSETELIIYMKTHHTETKVQTDKKLKDQVEPITVTIEPVSSEKSNSGSRQVIDKQSDETPSLTGLGNSEQSVKKSEEPVKEYVF